MSVDDDPPSGPAYPAFMGRVSDEHQRGRSGRKSTNGTYRQTNESIKTKTKIETGDDSKIDDDAHHRDDDDDDESIDEENGDTKRDGESFDEEEDFWLTRKLVEQHRRDGCSVSSISKAIFKDIRLAKQGLSDAHLTQLEYVFGENNLGRALDVAASGGVTRFVGKKSRRIVYAVRATTTSGSGKWTSPNNGGGMKGQQTPTQQHLTYPDHFCACKAFAWDVISRDEKLMCKHMLAAALAESVGGCDEVEMDDVVLANLLTKEMLE